MGSSWAVTGQWLGNFLGCVFSGCPELSVASVALPGFPGVWALVAIAADPLGRYVLAPGLAPWPGCAASVTLAAARCAVSASRDSWVVVASVSAAAAQLPRLELLCLELLCLELLCLELLCLELRRLGVRRFAGGVLRGFVGCLGAWGGGAGCLGLGGCVGLSIGFWWVVCGV
jgi:hypothetical protein